MKKNIIIAALCVFSVPMLAQKVTQLTTDKQKVSYAVGANIAKSLKQEDMVEEIDLDLLSQAMNDVFQDQQLLLPQDSMNVVLTKFGQKKSAEMRTKMEALSLKNKQEGEAFLVQNKKKKGVVTTPSGLQYEVLTKGKGTTKPKPEDMVEVTYTGKLLDGTIFDSTDKNNNGKPIEFQLNQVIKGWTEGVGLMNKGAKYRFYIPSDLAYGEAGAGAAIAPNSVLVFDVDLVDFKAPEASAP